MRDVSRRRWVDEEWKIDIDEEVDSKKKLDRRKKELPKQLRKHQGIPRYAAGLAGNAQGKVAAGTARY